MMEAWWGRDPGFGCPWYSQDSAQVKSEIYMQFMFYLSCTENHTVTANHITDILPGFFSVDN